MFSVTVIVYTNCSFIEVYKPSKTISLTLDYFDMIFGNIAQNTNEGILVFNNLQILSNGSFFLIAHIGIFSIGTSDIFFINEIYLLVSLISLEVKTI